MKTLNKLLALIILASNMLFISKISAQIWTNTVPLAPYHDEIRANTLIAEVLGGNATSGELYLTSFGLNNYFNGTTQLPNFMFDVYCDPTNGTLQDINVGCPNCTPANSVGYRIGGNMMFWNNGIPSSIFLGIDAGGVYPTPAGIENTFVGTTAGRHNTGTLDTGKANTYIGFAAGYSNGVNEMVVPGDSNVYVGFKSGYYNSSGSQNVFAGSMSGYSNMTGDSDVFIGDFAGFNNISGWGNNFMGNHCGYTNNYGYENVFSGNRCGYSNTDGKWNTFAGNHCGYYNTTGNSNSFYGKHAGYNNTTGDRNNFHGEHCGYNNTTESENCAYGANAFWSSIYGDSNVVMGNDADYYGGLSADSVQNLDIFIGDWTVRSFRAGDSNVFVGAMADVNVAGGIINNAGAIGYGAVATASDKIILGNNIQNIGIGMSGLNVGRGPTNRLEISNYSFAYASPCYYAPSSTFNTRQCLSTVLNPETGASGLQFRDLTHASVPYPNDSNSGFLTVDDSGNVVLMYAPNGKGSGIGTCSSPSTFPPGQSNDPTIDLSTNIHNFWFEGNHLGDTATNVYVGYNCADYPSVPIAKLNVLQESGAYNTTCGYFENKDGGAHCEGPVIGIESLVDGPTTLPGYEQVAGWFQTSQAGNCCLSRNQYAILIPQNGGVVSIGLPGATTSYVPCAQNYLLNVYGSVWAMTGYHRSDSTLKTNVTSISQNNNALLVIQKLNGVSFNYVDSVIMDSGMTGTHYGFIAQQVKRVLPSLVKTDNNGIEGVAYTEIIPWTVEAIKQEKQTNDSLRSTLDSLRNAFKNIQNCLSTLCGSGYAPVHGRGGNGNSGDSNSTIVNIQDVTLSASANAPLLYQNIPNPFSTGTKINYYLPIGTQGATMVFYDTYGNQIKVVSLSQTGNGTLNITPDNLTGGIYSYSLVVNNNIIDTKRMILQK